MRVGIDYRMLSAGNNTVHRGMGRYTQQQLREVIRCGAEHEYVLCCRPDADINLILPEIRTAANVTIAHIDQPIEQLSHEANRPEHVLRYAESYQEWLYRQRIELYHATTPFLFQDTIFSSFTVCPVVANFYDAIPLIFSQQYLLPDTSATEIYTRALHFVRKADRCIAISKSARQDAINYIGVPAEQIDIAYPVADPHFRILPPSILHAQLAALRRRIALPDKYILSVIQWHPSKNIETLLAAYSTLPASLRRELPLVLTAILGEGVVAHVQGLLDRYAFTDNVILTDHLPEEALVAVYNAATMLVHPARYEGFGLPVLEAMQCGTPVIATTASSLPEVAGDAAILVDPDDEAGFAAAMERLYRSPGRRAEMRALGIEQARRFDGAQLGQSTLAAYNRAVQPVLVPARTRVALWTPLPPQKSGIADYSAELLKPLAQEYDVEVFVDDGYLPALDLLEHYTIQHYLAFERRERQRPFDVIIYQIGASFYHVYMYEALQRWPGIVVLHDLVWGLLRFAVFARAQNLAGFKAELLELEGPQALSELEAIERQSGGLTWQAADPIFNTYYMLRRIVDSSLAIVVHMDLAKRELEGRYPHAKLYTIRMGVEDPWRNWPNMSLLPIREQLGLRGAAFIVGIFGIVDPVKRVDVCIRAFHDLNTIYPDSLLLIVGDFGNKFYAEALEAQIRHSGLQRQVRMVGHAEQTLFDNLLLACDVVVNLRYPSRKQMSATLVRAIAAGKPIIMTDLPEWDFFPREVCWRLTPDDREIATLSEYLLTLAKNPQLRQRISSDARAYFEQACSIPGMLKQYQTIIQQSTGHTAAVPDQSILLKENKPMSALHFNKVAEVEDFSDPELISVIRDVFRHEIQHFTDEFPKGAEYRKYWEIGMSVLALRRLGALRPDATILGVGAGTETTLFYLTKQVKQVFATDLYLNPGIWGNFAPGFMLFEPEKVAPYEFDSSRLVVQHMDGRALNYPDNSFDGIFSSGSIEHFGGHGYVANAAYEMGRVLKPGGILTLSTEFRISGPPGGIGWEGCLAFSRDELLRYIVEASGLELVDELSTDISTATLATQRNLSDYLIHATNYIQQQGRYPRTGEIVWPNYPHMVLLHQGYVFCSVHLTLRKTEQYPVKPNGWARPTAATIEAISRMQSTPEVANGNLSMPPEIHVSQLSESLVPPGTTDIITTLENLYRAWDGQRIRGWYNRTLRRLPRPLAAVGRTMVRVMQLGRVFEAQAHLYGAMIQHHATIVTRLDHLGTQLMSLVADIGHHNEQIRASQHAAEYQRELETRLTDLTTQIARIDQFVTQAMPVIERQPGYQAQLDAHLAALTFSLSQLEAHINAAEAQLEAIHAAHARVDERLRYQTSFIRLQQQQAEIAQQAAGVLPATRLTGVALVDLFQMLEHDFPKLATCNAIELSIQDGLAEDVLAAGTGYFGARMSSAANNYRAPNDAVYHVDFTPDWQRATLFVSAAARLVPGGWFTIITDPDNTLTSNVDLLETIDDRVMSLKSGQCVRVFIWRAPDKTSAAAEGQPT